MARRREKVFNSELVQAPKFIAPLKSCTHQGQNKREVGSYSRPVVGSGSFAEG